LPDAWLVVSHSRPNGIVRCRSYWMQSNASSLAVPQHDVRQADVLICYTWQVYVHHDGRLYTDSGLERYEAEGIQDAGVAPGCSGSAALQAVRWATGSVS
jgi:hypothetical protein